MYQVNSYKANNNNNNNNNNLMVVIWIHSVGEKWFPEFLLHQIKDKAAAIYHTGLESLCNSGTINVATS
jgi:hypothetical protein